MGLTVEMASAFDLLEALDDHGGRGRVTRARFGDLARQVSEGVALTIRAHHGLLVAVVGLWPEADHAEAWLAAGPGLKRNLRSGLVRMDAALVAIASETAPQIVRAYVRSGAGRVAGARLASWLGFDVIGTEATPFGPVTVFERTFGGEA